MWRSVVTCHTKHSPWIRLNHKHGFSLFPWKFSFHFCPLQCVVWAPVANKIAKCFSNLWKYFRRVTVVSLFYLLAFSSFSTPKNNLVIPKRDLHSNISTCECISAQQHHTVSRRRDCHCFCQPDTSVTVPWSIMCGKPGYSTENTPSKKTSLRWGDDCIISRGGATFRANCWNYNTQKPNKPSQSILSSGRGVSSNKQQNSPANVFYIQQPL